MKRELAYDITNHLTPQVLKTLEEFADYKIDVAKKNLVGAQDMETVRREQGVVRAMEDLKKIRAMAVDVLKMEK